MTKWCITWEDAENFIKAFKKWRESHPSKYLDSHGLEYALRSLFEHKGFWMEKENNG